MNKAAGVHFLMQQQLRARNSKRGVHFLIRGSHAKFYAVSQFPDGAAGLSQRGAANTILFI